MPAGLVNLFAAIQVRETTPPHMSPSGLIDAAPSGSGQSLGSLTIFATSYPIVTSAAGEISSNIVTSLVTTVSYVVYSSATEQPTISAVAASWPLTLTSLVTFYTVTATSLFSNSLWAKVPVYSPDAFDYSVTTKQWVSRTTGGKFLHFFILDVGTDFPRDIILPTPFEPTVGAASK